MPVRTCLLITDDLDDHQAFSEALSEISSETVALIILDSDKALALLKEKRHVPDFIILDLSMAGIRINTFLKGINSEAALGRIPTVVYGESTVFEKIENPKGLVFFDKDYEYSELKKFLHEFISPLTNFE